MQTEIFSDNDSLLLAFLNNSPAIGWLKDDQGRHVFLSQPYLDEIGVSGDNWFGKTDFDLWPEDIAEKFREMDRQVLASGQPLGFEDSENVSYQGRERAWYVVKFPFKDANNQRYVGGMAVDITEQKIAEAERHILEREISEVIENEQRRIGQDLHDGIGQELTALALYAASLNQKIEDAEKAGLIDSSAFAALQPLAAKLASGIANSNKQLQTVSRGMYPVHVKADQLTIMLNELADITNGLDGIACSLHQSGNIECRDAATATHLFRIAQESVNNAVKHSSCSQISISVQQRDEELCLNIIDDGIGMDENPDPRRAVPSGMGLRIMQYRADLIGGKLNVESAADSGTIVRCLLKRN